MTPLRLTMVTLSAIALVIQFACGAVPTSATGSTVVLGHLDAGRTVQVRVGDTVRVALLDDFPVPGAALVWDVTSANEAVLARGVVSRSSLVPSGPGQHDTYTANFRAMAAGQAALDAHGTTSCEAMPKQSCPDRDFKITVVVSS